MKTHTLSFRTKLTLMMAALIPGATALAAPFIPGNIVVLQAGDGSAPLGNATTPQFVLEYLPGTLNQAGPVQTIAIPTNGPSRLLIAGNATSEGHIAISLNQSNLTFQG